jgi:hypothetical protein
MDTITRAINRAPDAALVAMTAFGVVCTVVGFSLQLVVLLGYDPIELGTDVWAWVSNLL